MTRMLIRPNLTMAVLSRYRRRHSMTSFPLRQKSPHSELIASNAKQVKRNVESFEASLNSPTMLSRSAQSLWLSCESEGKAGDP